ncbi:MAG: response regulator [Cellvibrionaceae bacterium]
MNNLSYRSRFLLPLLLPIVGITVALAVILGLFYTAHISRAFDEQGHADSRQLAELARRSLTSDYLPPTEVVQPLLDETAVRSVSLYNAEGQRIAHAGPQPLADGKALIFDTQRHKVPAQETSSFVNPISDLNNGQLLGWAVVEMDHEGLRLATYKTLLGVAAITLAVLLVGVALTVVAALRALAPLDRIREALQQCATGNLSTTLVDTDNGLFTDLARSIDMTSAHLRESQQAMQENIDQATRDLRETLETVEIQNVELSLARKEALEASRAKSEFLANTSHEIRTPINGIIGFTGLLLKTVVNAQQKEYLHTIQKSSQGLLTTINAILDVSKIETGQLVLDYSPLHLRDVVEEPLSVLAPAALEKKLQLFSIVDATTPLHFLGDPLRLKQVITNLVSNAIKFSDNGNIVLRVTQIKNDGHNAILRFSVEDSGIGIHETKKPELFKAFSQADSSNARSQGGTGLGLAVCKGLVKQMAGDIGVESTIGRGTVFWFTATLGLDGNAPLLPFETLRGQRILVCCNDPASIEQLSGYLQVWQTNFSVVDQPEALESQLREHGNLQVSAIIWDISEQKDPRGWATSNPLLKKLTQVQGTIQEQQPALVLLTMPGCDLDYQQDRQDAEVAFVSRPVCHNALYDALCQQIDGLHAREDSNHRREARASDQSQGPRIMAVDDNPANLQLIGELLKDLGAQVALATDGSEALELFHQQNFDLVFMDIQMPVLDGLETTRRMRALEDGTSRTPVVALTAHAMTDQKADLLLAGMDDYLSKPVSEAQLLHVIRRWIHPDAVAASVGEGNHDSAPEGERSDTSVDKTNSAPVNIQLSLSLSNNKPALARDMLSMLLKALPQDAEAIDQLFKEEDFDALEATVHKLRGGASYCGVPYLKSTSTALDNMLQKKSYKDLDKPVAELLNAIQQLIVWQAEHDLDALFGLEEVDA